MSNRYAGPLDFHGSFPVFRPILLSYDSATKTPDLSDFFCVKIADIVVHYVRLCTACALH